ncbi:BhlA/UviB family holin-like peptide [Sporolactobacillus shoreicorticis]|uniref:BhlA/UviB family holin-like peptide n=1 Tax=Sporolactobacillus shoreicorticis TaxID=1923877 RepID=A0ABW5RYD2_9BACL|nr:BhlA/UviB family holin-like peptide [Sporolactobacillus shoreicorticis]MCO7125127.1 BhlA/UviB family holin-like peptide [Sporolactobacillus shoreicorticis]
MESQVISYFLTQGPFGALFVWLLFSYRKEAHERETRLNQVINDQNKVLSEFSEKYDIVINKLDGIEERLPPQ